MTLRDICKGCPQQECGESSDRCNALDLLHTIKSLLHYRPATNMRMTEFWAMKLERLLRLEPHDPEMWKWMVENEPDCLDKCAGQVRGMARRIVNMRGQSQ